MTIRPTSAIVLSMLLDFRGTTAAVIAASAVLLGCNDKADCSLYATHVCDSMKSCNASRFYAWYGDRDTCAERERLRCEQLVSAPGSRTTAEDMDACVHDLACAPIVRTCRLPRGSLEDNAACVFGAQCASGVCSVRVGDEAYPACSTCHPRAAEGGQCEYTGDCEDGLYCYGSSCQRKLGSGAPCTLDACVDGLVCMHGVCTKRPMPGNACEVNEDCYNWFCADGTCQSYDEPLTEDDFGRVGEACALGMRCLAGSCDYCGICNPPREDVCLPLPQVGEACLSPFVDDVMRGDPLCMPPAVCSGDFGMCVLPADASCY